MTSYSIGSLEYLILTAVEVNNNKINSLGCSNGRSNLEL